jgi:hypothetical protein
MSDWDAYDGADETTLQGQAERFAHLSNTKQKIEEEMEGLKDKILESFAQEPGEQSLKAGETLVTVKIQERWEWDQDLMIDLYSDRDELPHHVSKRLTINKRKFNTLTDDEQKEVLPCLTRKLGTTTINVTEVKDV